MGSMVHVINISGDGDRNQSVVDHQKNNYLKYNFLWSIVSFVKKNEDDMRKMVHSFKVATALVLVSLVYFLDTLYDKVGDSNAMWAIMTVVVIFEFHAGATLSKGLNRGLGTVLGGALGCSAAILGQQIGGKGNSVIVGISLFIFGGAATYTRMIPSIKRRYDYGAMVFILTFNLVSVSGLRAQEVIQIARQRLVMIVLGFIITICSALFFFPMWASDEIHRSMVSRFHSLAASIEGCLDECFTLVSEEENQAVQNPFIIFGKCKSVLQSKAKDESLINFAKWEPWHGKFGLFYPWEKYQKIGDVLRDLAAIILSLQASLQYGKEGFEDLKESMIKEQVGSSFICTLKELGESVKKMRRCRAEDFILPKLKLVRQDVIRNLMAASKSGRSLEEINVEGLAIASFVFTLTQMVDKLEELAKEVEELGQIADFLPTTFSNLITTDQFKLHIHA